MVPLGVNPVAKRRKPTVVCLFFYATLGRSQNLVAEGDLALLLITPKPLRLLHGHLGDVHGNSGIEASESHIAGDGAAHRYRAGASQ